MSRVYQIFKRLEKFRDFYSAGQKMLIVLVLI